MMKISYFLQDTGGCSWYRAMQPLDMLHELKLAEVMRCGKGETSERTGDALANADVVVLPRLALTETINRIVAELKIDRKLVVADLDDNIWAVTPLSPHYADYGMVEFQYKMPDKRRINVWKDGVGTFSIKRNRERLDAVKRALNAVDLVTTTTDLLADVLRQFNPKVAVLPNCVDLKRWQKVDLKPHDDFRIFWAGGSSHFEDWQILGQVMPEVMKKFPQVTLVLMGVKFEGLLKNLPQDRVEFHLWEDNLSYPYKCSMLGADLCLIPLVDNEFNRCKSAIKWIEQSALGVPSVVSYVSPYAEIYDGENAMMVHDNDIAAWIHAISIMIEDNVVRAQISGAAERYVTEHFDIRKRAIDWLNIYEQNLPQKLEDLCLSQKSGT